VLPVDYVKIDGVFVKDMLDNPFDLALVRSIAEVARAGGMLTIGEFAHNQAVIESLRDIGVDYAQGYGIAMPKPITEF
jgi:EAL domain-containing protein (putative c-di-GMP-specific phosphodiesterase class I)